MRTSTQFSIVERAYSKVVTPDNFMSRSGLLLSEIKGALQNNKILREHFGLLVGESHSFLEKIIDIVYQYLAKVFCNLRAKDVALKYNSNLNASNTVGLRQTLAGGLAIRKAKKQSSKGVSKYKNMRVPELKDLCRQRKLIVGGLKAALIARLEEFDQGEEVNSTPSAEDEDIDDDFPNEEDPLSDEAQHQLMLAEVDDTDSQREDDFQNAEKVSTREVSDEAMENDMQ